jgi:hypothetical protein
MLLIYTKPESPEVRAHPLDGAQPTSGFTIPHVLDELNGLEYGLPPSFIAIKRITTAPSSTKKGVNIQATSCDQAAQRSALICLDRRRKW